MYANNYFQIDLTEPESQKKLLKHYANLAIKANNINETFTAVSELIKNLSTLFTIDEYTKLIISAEVQRNNCKRKNLNKPNKKPNAAKSNKPNIKVENDLDNLEDEYEYYDDKDDFM